MSFSLWLKFCSFHLVECVANKDDEIGDLFLQEIEPTVEQLKVSSFEICLTIYESPFFCYVSSPSSVRAHTLDSFTLHLLIGAVFGILG